MAVIAVVGEALIDLVVGSGGQVDAHPGGGPYNAARTLARLGVPTAFLGRLAGDGFGRLLRERLTAEGVALGLAEPSPGPSTLAVATVDQAGVASYSFYLDGTAAADVSYQALRTALEGTVLEGTVVESTVPETVPGEPGTFPAGLTAVHVGTLGLLMEPVGAAIERLIVSDLPPEVLVFLDPNCRPGAVPDGAAYRARVAAVAARADIVKASVEDLAYLYPGMPPESAAKALLEAGPPLVLVTDGPRPARAFMTGSVLSAEAPSVTVADTIGAGDAFGGGFLAWWTEHGLDRADLYRDGDGDDRAGDDGAGYDRAGQSGADRRREELVGQALRAAAAVAALTCARPGADPPVRADVVAKGWWPEAGGPRAGGPGAGEPS
jgi:fructokinase